MCLRLVKEAAMVRSAALDTGFGPRTCGHGADFNCASYDYWHLRGWKSGCCYCLVRLFFVRCDGNHKTTTIKPIAFQVGSVSACA